MTDGIQQTVQKVVEQAVDEIAKQKSDSGVQTPEVDDVKRFEEAMQKSDVEPEKTAKEVSTQSAQPADPGREQQAIGDSILKSMDKIKGTREEKEKIINELLAKKGDSMSVQDSLRLQHELMQLNLQTEITTKAADKSSQGVQTLLKNQ